MLTEAQLYNLGIGDEIIVHGTCEDVYPDKDIRVSSYWTVAGETRTQSFLVKSSCVSLPPKKPKYDPCRKFKKGDKVQVSSLNGRCYGKYGKYLLGAYCIVLGDEADEFGVRVRHNADDYILDPAYLKLITPAEEFEPYSVEEIDVDSIIFNPKLDPERDSESAFHVKYADKCSGEMYIVKTYYESDIYSYECAKADSEAECKRLNDEWRKKQNDKQD